MATAFAHIRRAVHKDHDAVVSLLDQLAADEHLRDPGHFQDRTYGVTAAVFATLVENQKELHLVAEVENEVTGYARELPSRQAGADGEISLAWSRLGVHLQLIVVAPKHRLRGVGRALFAAVEAWAAERNAEYIGLNVSAHNVDAKLFYAAQGYAATIEYLTKTIRPIRRVASRGDRGQT